MDWGKSVHFGLQMDNGEEMGYSEVVDQLFSTLIEQIWNH